MIKDYRFKSTAVFSFAVLWLLAVAATTQVWGRTAPTDVATVKQGSELYRQKCAACHGLSGKGDTPVARSYSPPPTDFTKGEFRHGTSDDDLFRSISSGVPTTAMTGWRGKLSEDEILSVIAYLRTLKK